MKTKHKHYAVLTASTLGLTGLSFASGFGDEKYIYDASGNILEKQIGDQVTRFDYTGNQLNGSKSDSTRKQYAYDSSGRLTSDSEVGKPTRNLEHQYLDKVTKVQNGDKTTEFFYNAEGQLVATNSGGTSETFAWDGLAMVNRGEKLYVNESHSVGGVPAIVGNEVAVSDMIGSSLSVGSESYKSTAFGEGLDDGLFTGKPFINGLEGFLFKFRTLSVQNASWFTVDPSGFPDGPNQSRYVGGDPVNRIDPLGLSYQISVTGGPPAPNLSGSNLTWDLDVTGDIVNTPQIGDTEIKVTYKTTGNIVGPGGYGEITGHASVSCNPNTGDITITQTGVAPPLTSAYSKQGYGGAIGTVVVAAHATNDTHKLNTSVTHSANTSNRAGVTGGGVEFMGVAAQLSWSGGGIILNALTNCSYKSEN